VKRGPEGSNLAELAAYRERERVASSQFLLEEFLKKGDREQSEVS